MRTRRSSAPAALLIGPYDPHCGEYTFLAPPLGVWRLAGVLRAAGITAEVFDPNCCEGAPRDALSRVLAEREWDIVGVSTTGMTLRYDLELAHHARAVQPGALVIAGGMEATFNPELMFRLGPFDLVVLGEGENPLKELARRLAAGESLEMIPGTATRAPGGGVNRYTQHALTPAELREAIFRIPYESMPYAAYWKRLENAYRVKSLPHKAQREARLAEIRSVRLITLNYCPMGCTFCSSTNYLHEAQGSVASIARLEADECIAMLKRIVAAHPTVRTVIFQDDIFVFTKDKRILPLCEGIVAAKARGELPQRLQFISTNRIDAMDEERLAAMRRAGFRVLGFGVENFSRNVLAEFNKKHIYEFIEPVLAQALALGITPFLDLILTSPRCGLGDLAETIRQAERWVAAGCEIGMYPYVIPFSGAAMARDPALKPHTDTTRQHVGGTAIAWDQPSRILPLEATVREAILEIEGDFLAFLGDLEAGGAHLPSRVRSMIWIACAIPVLARHGEAMPDRMAVLKALAASLPGLGDDARVSLRRRGAPAAERVLAGD
jgi:radical SAM superfamily enzyme YgiQ (UPF0313 family)